MANHRLPFEINMCYHVYNRGYMKQRLFHSAKDYNKFSDYVDEYIIEFPMIKVYVYCLLPNHFHFIVEQNCEGFFVSEFMRKVQVSYANYYKAKYKKTKGVPLYEGRFRSKILLNEKYLLACYNYIQYNPLKHELVDAIDKRPYLFLLRPVAQ